MGNNIEIWVNLWKNFKYVEPFHAVEYKKIDVAESGRGVTDFIHFGDEQLCIAFASRAPTNFKTQNVKVLPWQ